MWRKLYTIFDDGMLNLYIDCTVFTYVAIILNTFRGSDF